MFVFVSVGDNFGYLLITLSCGNSRADENEGG